jgi:hypothetical protein
MSETGHTQPGAAAEVGPFSLNSGHAGTSAAGPFRAKTGSDMADMAQGALFILPCAFLYGLTVFLFRDQIKSILPPPWPLIWINSLTSREENMPATL